MSAIKMLHTIKAAPDNNHTREYAEGEVYEIDEVNDAGDCLMPQWLADTLCEGGYTYYKPVKHTTNEGITHVPTGVSPAAILVQEGTDPMVSKEKQGKQGKGPRAIKAPKKKVAQPKQKEAQK